jgi:sugar phosphate isomerase/epimerase
MDSKGRSHLCPGQGELDFDQLFKNYYDREQWLTIEVRPALEAVKAKQRFESIMTAIGET